MSVDFPAPLGPITPTRLYRGIEISFHIISRHREREVNSHLDNVNAQLTLNKLGTVFPGYVNVQFVIFKIALVLLLTPMSDPGGGKANLTEVAARV